jgi:hypothetical protein
MLLSGVIASEARRLMLSVAETYEAMAEEAKKRQSVD